jgi:hypothetical protein
MTRWSALTRIAISNPLISPIPLPRAKPIVTASDLAKGRAAVGPVVEKGKKRASSPMTVNRTDRHQRGDRSGSAQPSLPIASRTNQASVISALTAKNLTAKKAKSHRSDADAVDAARDNGSPKTSLNVPSEVSDQATRMTPTMLTNRGPAEADLAARADQPAKRQLETTGMIWVTSWIPT